MSDLKDKFAHLPTALQELFHRYHLRQLHLRGRVALAFLGAGYVAAVVVATHVDRFMRFGVGWRAASCAVVHVGMILLAVLAARSWWRRRHPSPALAYEIEDLLKHDEEHLVSAFDLLSAERGHPLDSAVMKELLAARAEELAHDVSGPLRPRDRRLSMAGALLAGESVVIAALLAFPAYQFGLMLRRFYQPFAELPHASFTQIAFGDYPNPVGRGADVTIPVRLGGRLAREARCEVIGEDGNPVLATMQRIGRDAFVHTLYHVRHDQSFRVLAGDAISPWQTLRVVEQPQIEGWRITVRPPAYSGREAVTLDQPAEIHALAGSEIELEVACAQELALAEVVVFRDDGNEIRHALAMDDGRGSWRIAELKHSKSYRILLTNREGFDNLDRDEHRILCVQDRPPEITVEDGQEVVRMFPAEERNFMAVAEDDLGLTALSLSFTVNPNPDLPAEPQRIPFEDFAPPPTNVRREVPVSLATLKVEPGDVIEFTIDGADTGGNQGSSNPILIQVVSFEPGLDEQRRIDFLRMLADTLARLVEQASRPEPGQLGMPAEAAAALVERATEMGVSFPELTDDPAVLMARIVQEHDMTPFYVYRADLRDVMTMIGTGVYADLATAPRTRRMAWLAEQLLPAQIQFRFQRNLLRAIGAFGDQAGRLTDETTTVASREKQAVQLRASVARWCVLLARISRESPWPESGFAVFEDAITAANTAAHQLDVTAPATAQALVNALNAIGETSRRLLPELSARLEPLRQEAEVVARDDMSAFRRLASDAAQRPHQFVLAPFLRHGLAHDPALAPEEGLEEFAFHLQLVDGETGADKQRGFDPRQAAVVAFLGASARLYRQADFNAMLVGIRANATRDEAGLAYDLEQFRHEHQQYLNRLPLAGEAEPLAARLGAQRTFQEAAATAFGPLGQLVRHRVTALIEAQRQMHDALEKLDQMVAAFVPEDTIAERCRLLDSYDELERQAELIIAALRVALAADLWPEPPATAWRIAWARVLVRLQERLDHMRENARDPVAVWRRFHGLSLDQKERDLLQARLQIVIGANRSLQRICTELPTLLEENVPEDDFFVRESRALAVTEDLERHIRETDQIVAATTSAAGEAKDRIAAVLKPHPELPQALLAELVAPQVKDLHQRLDHLQVVVNTARESDGDADSHWLTLATELAGLQKNAGLLLNMLADMPMEGTAGYAENLRTIMERLASLPRETEALRHDGALVAFTLDELRTHFRQFVAGLERATMERGVAVVPRDISLARQAALAARRSLAGTVRQWELQGARHMLDFLRAAGDDATLTRAAFTWQAALNLKLSPPMLRETQIRFAGSRGDAVTDRRHWLVDEFEDSLRLPLPRRHRTETEDYYRRLQEAFREHEHTR